MPKSDSSQEGESKDAFSNFLREMRADRKAETFTEMAERLAIERRIRRFFENLKKEGYVIQENLDESIAFDFLIRRFDREALVTLKYQRNEFSLSKEELTRLHKMLESNSLSEGIIVVWVLSPEYLSVYLSIFKLNKLLMKDVKRFSFSVEVQSLDSCISGIFRKTESLVGELKPKTKASALAKDRKIASRTFNETIQELFKDLKQRRYKLKHKKEALKSLSRRDLLDLQEVFNLTLEGKFEKKILEETLERIANRSEYA